MKFLRIAFLAAWMTGCVLPLALAQDTGSAPVGGGVQLGRLLRDSIAELPQYSCDLRKQFSQCRQYVVAPGNSEFRVKELSEACVSLEGVLTQSPCPQEKVIAQCQEVKFRRDAVYDAFYYQSPSSIWSVERIQEACRHLPGNFVAIDR